MMIGGAIDVLRKMMCFGCGRRRTAVPEDLNKMDVPTCDLKIPPDTPKPRREKPMQLVMEG